MCLLVSTFSFKCEAFILDIVLIIVSSDNFPQDAAATVSTMEEAASVDGSIRRVRGVLGVREVVKNRFKIQCGKTDTFTFKTWG